MFQMEDGGLLGLALLAIAAIVSIYAYHSGASVSDDSDDAGDDSDGTASARRLLPVAVEWVREGRPGRGVEALETLRRSLDDPPAERSGAGFVETHGEGGPELLALSRRLCRDGFGARVPIFDFDTEAYAIEPQYRNGLLAFDLDGTTVCDDATIIAASEAMCKYRSYGFAVVVITARSAPLFVPRSFERCVQAIFYNSSGRDVPAVKATQLSRARRALAPRAPRGSCVLLDDRLENVDAASSAGFRAILSRCSDVDWRTFLMP